MIRVLIFGGSSFIGESLFKELNPFYDLYATYYSNIKFKTNKRFIYYSIQNDPNKILVNLKPDVVISGLRGDFNLQVLFYEQLIEYCEKNKTKLMFLSSSNVFDSFINYPSFEEDKTFSRSSYGRFNIHIENKILRMKNKNWCINRSAMIFSKKSKRIENLKQNLKKSICIEIFPNLIININSEEYLSKQIHYIISRNLRGIFHHGSYDLINHEELIKIILSKLNANDYNYKYVYTTNENRYLSLLSKSNKLPQHLNFSFDSIISKII
ncbi:MAG: sugar nucleotide-binding protein [Flavobacteriaceae bacterium]|nr:sugar nucleotide-binding protein [Flavobacteriaceae bacterium]